MIEIYNYYCLSVNPFTAPEVYIRKKNDTLYALSKYFRGLFYVETSVDVFQQHEEIYNTEIIAQGGYEVSKRVVQSKV